MVYLKTSYLPMPSANLATNCYISTEEQIVSCSLKKKKVIPNLWMLISKFGRETSDPHILWACATTFRSRHWQKTSYMCISQLMNFAFVTWSANQHSKICICTICVLRASRDFWHDSLGLFWKTICTLSSQGMPVLPLVSSRWHCGCLPAHYITSLIR